MKQLSFDDVARRPPPPPAPHVHSVAELAQLAAQALEARFTAVWVEAEISNCKHHPSGHVYFTLKDATAQIPAVMWRTDARRLKFKLCDGLRVRCRGTLSVYAAQGKFQIYVALAEPAGLGALQLQFEQLKARLQAEGLFDAARKRPLPFLPRTVGVATSESGAALRDIVRVLHRRFPARVLVAPCAVQGDGAPAEIVRALGWLGARDDVDVVIVGRGGGSMEDLWAFNDEAVARAIAACRHPVVSAVGHEVDFTIADFVADLRAPTPSAAAERVVPEKRELSALVATLVGRSRRALARRLREGRLRLDDVTGRTAAAAHRRIAAGRRRIDALAGRLGSLHPRARLAADRTRLVRLDARLAACASTRLLHEQERLDALRRRLDAVIALRVSARRSRLCEAAGKLDALSPLRVLERGYALARTADGHVLVDAAQVAPGDAIALKLAKGALTARVEKREP